MSKIKIKQYSLYEKAVGQEHNKEKRALDKLLKKQSRERNTFADQGKRAKEFRYTGYG